eukprot:tig00020904_g15243.t1
MASIASTPPRIPSATSLRLQPSGSIRLQRDGSINLKASASPSFPVAPPLSAAADARPLDPQDLSQKIAFLEAENEKLTRQLQEGNASSQVELAFLRRQLEEATEKAARSRERIARVDQVEGAVISLYLEMKDRSAEGDTPADLEKERAELKGQNPIVVLDYLRANLRTLLAFKEEYENELKSQLARKRSEQERQIDALKSEMAALRAGAGEAGERVREAEGRVRLAEEKAREREALLRDEVRRLEGEVAGAERRVDERDLEISRMKVEMRRLKDVERSKDIKITHIAQVENQVQALKVQHEHEVHKIHAPAPARPLTGAGPGGQVRHAKTVERYERELARLNAVEGEKQALEGQLRVASVTTESYRTDMRRADALRADRAVERLEAIAARQAQEITALTKQLRRAQMVVQNTIGRNESLRKEYDKIVEALREQRGAASAQEEQARQEMQSQLGSASAEKSTAYTSVMYRQQLKEKDREIAELTNKVRRLMGEGLRRTRTAEGSLLDEEAKRKRVEEELSGLKAAARRFQPMLKAERTFDSALPSAGDASSALKGLGMSPGLAAAMGLAPSPSIAAYQEEQMAALQQRAAMLEARLRDMELDAAIASGGLHRGGARSPGSEGEEASRQSTYLPVPQGSPPLGDWVDTAGQRGLSRRLFPAASSAPSPPPAAGPAAEGEGEEAAPLQRAPSNTLSAVGGGTGSRAPSRPGSAGRLRAGSAPASRAASRTASRRPSVTVQLPAG